ncbi:MAG: hypothetical protein EOM23_06915 [Candidatus Moranbacteria bacterium]|nr:hypothetical protein [Candidatus Moranbacteria bacterium]
MGRAKEIIIKVIPAKIANEFVKKHHYSGKVVPNSILHFGCFLDNQLHGVLSYGSPLDKSKVLPLVQPSLWNEMLELNRMAFDEYLPKYSESRCIAISIKLLKKNAPHIKWILSFSDGTQCGDGTIYRASGFVLTGVNKNNSLLIFPTGDIIAGMTIEANFDLPIIKKQCLYLGIEHKYRTRNEWIKLGAKKLDGFQLRYIYLIDKSCKITVPILPFNKIDEMGAGMYKGKKISLADRRVKHKSDAV